MFQYDEYDQRFRERLAQLRTQKKVSAREMSLSLGQNAGYINSIENGKSLPGMGSFFNICDYLEITPEDYFSSGRKYPKLLERIEKYLSLLDQKSLEDFADILERTIGSKKTWR